MRTILILAAAENLEMIQFDMKILEETDEAKNGTVCRSGKILV